MLTRETYLQQPPVIEKELKQIFGVNDSLIIFDIGCCEGENSIKYSRLFPNARIFSVEALPSNIKILKENLHKYAVKNIEVLPFALSDKIGVSSFYVSSFYETNLSKYGFEILEIDTNGNFFEYVAQELRRVNYIGQRYANYYFSDKDHNKDHNTVYQTLCLLDSINQRQKNSQELLCFGYHILAVKKSNH